MVFGSALTLVTFILAVVVAQVSKRFLFRFTVRFMVYIWTLALGVRFRI